ncbi:MAG: beta-glucosidase [Chroococcus sp. CMT-3BRIN-NPC107]|jgi:beta-glucosidase|nr:beta-glucosidase [Chroococcus sp. CMT-3BRIN-NPC107]
MTAFLPDIDTLTLEQLVAQMVVVRTCGYLFDNQIAYPEWEANTATMQYLVELGIGGVIFLGGSAAELALRSQQMQSWAKIPLLIAADIEEGVGQRFPGGTWFPPPMAISQIARNHPQAEQYAEQMGAITAAEAIAIGINWILAPVVDVNNNPDNPVINIRAFGETPSVVSPLANAFIKGAKAYPVLTAAKHFPGHGDTTTDSHVDLPIIAHSSSRLAEIELVPFTSAIASGVDAVMSAHLLIEGWDSQYPATLSKRILTEQLRDRLGFTGLIVTDALMMEAISKRYGANESPVLAVEAGADILLMPSDPEGAINAVCEAVKSGRISAQRIGESVERIWHAKSRVEGVKIDPSKIALELSKPESLKTVEYILQQSQIVSGIPLSQTSNGRNLIVVDNLLGSGKFLTEQSPAIVLPKSLGYTTWLCDRHTPFDPNLETDNLPTLLQLFIRGNPFRGSSELTQIGMDWFKKLSSSNNLQALVIYGSPYILEKLTPAMDSEIPCVFSYGQMPQAQTIALQVLFSNK